MKPGVSIKASGQNLTELGLILGVVVLIGIVAVTFLGGNCREYLNFLTQGTAPTAKPSILAISDTDNPLPRTQLG